MATEVGAGTARCGAAAGTGPGEGTEPNPALPHCPAGVGGVRGVTGWDPPGAGSWGLRARLGAGLGSARGALAGGVCAGLGCGVGQVAGGDGTLHGGHDMPLAPPSSSPSRCDPQLGGCCGFSSRVGCQGWPGPADPFCATVPPLHGHCRPAFAPPCSARCPPPAGKLLGTEGCPHAACDTPGDTHHARSSRCTRGQAHGPHQGLPGDMALLPGDPLPSCSPPWLTPCPPPRCTACRSCGAARPWPPRSLCSGTTATGPRASSRQSSPPELESRIERQLFEETVKTLNSFYAEAEKIGGSSYLEGCLACATAYFIFLCMETHYEKVLKKISKYIQEQNEKIYAPRGLLLTDPLERGMRVIEISIYEDRCSSGSSSSGSSSSSSGGGGGGAGGR
uniref:Golgin A7 family member B n=1 Tax=Anas platyrhynchos platyrhynchos TaxID=8840 RepID=A0A493T632_ANAPP